MMPWAPPTLKLQDRLEGPPGQGGSAGRVGSILVFATQARGQGRDSDPALPLAPGLHPLVSVPDRPRCSPLFLSQGFQGKTGPPGPPGVVGPQVRLPSGVSLPAFFSPLPSQGPALDPRLGKRRGCDQWRGWGLER